MRNTDIDLGRPGWVVQACMKIASRLKKVRLKLNVSLHVDRPHRRTEFLKLRDKLLLYRRGKLPASLRAQVLPEKFQIVLDNETLNRLSPKFTPPRRHRLLVGEEPPSPGAEHREQDD